MGRLSARSNPTELIEIDKSRVSLSILQSAGSRAFLLDRLELKGLDIPQDMHVMVVARAGNTNTRYAMGSVGMFDRTAKAIDTLDASQPLRFRVLIHPAGTPKLVASAENIRPRDDAQSESLLPMEPAELGERVWKLVINDDGPVLQFNASVFPSAAGAENYVPFGSMVLPEALYEVMHEIVEEPGRLEDEDDPWFAWGAWLDAIGAERPQDLDGDEAKRAWCHQAVDRFCVRFGFASRLRLELTRSAGDD
jgi:hypothetical protein